MKNIYLISDLHFNHDKDFIWKARGYNSIEEMNDSLVKSFNEVVFENDIVYILGDLMMGQLNDEKWLSQLKGEIHYIIGNHDTTNRREYYESLGFICEGYATVIKYKKHSFYLSHYPTLVQNSTDDRIHNIHGHTHSTNFREFLLSFNVAVDAIKKPISIEEIYEIVKWEREMNHREI